MDSKTRGLYNKFDVTRTDGSSGKGRKHEHCNYFVLDIDHDPYTIPAILGYAKACKKEYPALARDILKIMDPIIKSQLPKLQDNIELE